MFENFNADHNWRRKETGRNSRGFSQKINERILRQWQQTYFEKFLCLLQCFLFYEDQRRKDGNDYEGAQNHNSRIGSQIIRICMEIYLKIDKMVKMYKNSYWSIHTSGKVVSLLFSYCFQPYKRHFNNKINNNDTTFQEDRHFSTYLRGKNQPFALLK